MNLSNDSTKVKVGKDRDRVIGSGWNPLDPTIVELTSETDRDDRRLRLAFLLAAIVHLVIFAVKWPASAEPPREVGGGQKVFVLNQPRFEKPKPKPKAAQPIEVQKPKARKIPVPDPTPDDPEPIREIEIESLPEVSDVVADAGAVFGIPDGPPFAGAGVMNVGGDVLPPVKVYEPRPRYPEDARRARLEGVVVLETIIDTDGNVDNVRVLKGLGHGLSEAAVEAVKTWKFKPATRLGEPVAVRFILTVQFGIQ